MKKTDVVILAAGDLQNYYWPRRFNEHPLYLSNLGNNTNINIIKNSYDSKKYDLSLVIDNKNDISKFEKYQFCSGIKNFIKIDKTDNILETIYKILGKFKDKEELIIQTITLIPHKSINIIPNSLDVVKTTKKGSWQMIEINQGNETNKYAIAGRLFVKIIDLKDFFKSNSFHNKGKLKSLYLYLIEKKDYKINHVNWIDSGHIETLSRTRTDYCLSRSFNNIKYDRLRNSVIKSSNKYQKLNSEYLFYKNLSSKCSRFYPKVYNFVSEKSKEKCQLELEFIPGFTLSEIFIFYNISDYTWTDIFEKLKYIYKQHLVNHENDISSLNKVYDYMYLEKTRLRINQFEKYFLNEIQKDKFSYQISKILNNEFFLNGKKFCSFKKAINNLIKSLKIQIEMDESEEIYPIHGDMCFNNIIYDPFFGSLKLIDPRGKDRSGLDLYPKCYDIAKISHSVLGLYDLIISGIYYLDFKENNFEFHIHRPPNYEIVKNNFKNYFKIDESIRLKELTLFASMLPMHLDSKERTLALLLRFFQIYSAFSF